MFVLETVESSDGPIFANSNIALGSTPAEVVQVIGTEIVTVSLRARRAVASDAVVVFRLIALSVDLGRQAAEVTVTALVLLLRERGCGRRDECEVREQVRVHG